MDIDPTILIQLGLFCFLLVVLSNLLLRPLLRVIETRHQKIAGAKSEADRLTRLAAENQEAYQTRIREARNAARRERDTLVATGNEEKRKLLAEARAEIASLLNDARQKVSLAEMEAQRTLSTDTQALARRLVEKVLGREVQP